MPDSPAPRAAAPGSITEELAAIAADLRVTAELQRVAGYEKPTAALGHAERLLAMVRDVLELAGGTRPVLAAPPADCTYACGEGPCTCSGEFRVSAWNLDPAALRSAVSRHLPGGTPDGT